MITRVVRCVTIVCAVLAMVEVTHAQAIPAFPGADGAAAYAEGGRGGIVYHVTKLDSAIDDPQRNDFGTLRYGLNNNNFPAGPRTIVFDVGGVFSLGRLPRLDLPNPWDPNGNGWDAQSRLTIGGTNVTLAGQTAPGAGVILMGGGLKPQGNNNVIRNITMASGFGMRNWWDQGDPYPEEPVPNPSSLGPGIFPDSTVFDAMDISGTNLMIDHVSTLFATDETISMNEVSDNITVQYSNISQSLNYPQWDAEGGGFTGHALGSLLEAGSGAAISFHHNLYAHHKSRVPQAQGGNAFYDFRNNVFYNWLGTAGVSSGSTRMNFEGNFYLAGNGGENPVGGTNTGLTNANGGTGVIVDSSVYKNGNLRDTNKDGDAEDGVITGGGASSPFWSGGVVTYEGVTESAEDAYDNVLDYVGANWWTRDEVIDTPDERIINEVRTGTGKIIAWADDPWDDDPSEGQEWRDLVATPQTNRASDWDSELSIGYGKGDGMPTYWELKHGLNPNARDDTGDYDNDGYTNLEEYLNEVAAWPAPNAITFNNANGDGRFEHTLNWDSNPDPSSTHPWQPSRFDTAVVDNGVVSIDSVGQYAGNLLLATNPGDNATLNITGGWIEVEDAEHGLSNGMTVISDDPAAIATLNLSGGRLRTGTLLKGSGGAFNFTGGELSADTIGFDLVNNGGTIAPGQSPGVTEVLGSLTMNSGILEIEVADSSTFDRLSVTGDVSLGGLLELSILDGFTFTSGDTLEIIDVGGALSGQFIGLDEGAFVGNFGAGVFITYAGGDGNDVALFTLTTLPGDANSDGKVDILDLDILSSNFGAASGASLSTGDFNGDGAVDILDLDILSSNFGAMLSTAIPEPGAILSATLAVLAFTRCRARRCVS